MNKNGLLELLNENADSISLHDASLHGFKWINNTLEFLIGIGEYHFHINELEKFVDNTKDDVILTLKFEGIENVECAFYDDFRYKNAEIMENNLVDGVFEFIFLECGIPGRISFKYSKFEWDIIGEFDSNKMKEWYKENGIYEDFV